MSVRKGERDRERAGEREGRLGGYSLYLGGVDRIYAHIRTCNNTLDMLFKQTTPPRLH